MAIASNFPLHRPELLDALQRGDALITKAMGNQREQFRKGEEIIRTGEPCDTVFRIESGWVAGTRLLDDGRRSIILIFLPGDLFGVKSFLLTEQPDAVQCLSNATVLTIHHERFRELFQSEPSVALRVAFQLGEDERRLHNYVVGLGRGIAAERIALLLLEMRGRLCRTGMTANASFPCLLTQQEIGDLLGLTLVHVNRVLGRLRHEGLATVQGNMVQIHDLAGLRKLAEPLLDLFERSRPEFGGPGSALSP